VLKAPCQAHPVPPPRPHAALPDWLPPWTDSAKRSASVSAACGEDNQPAAGYPAATLCAADGAVSPALSAALGGQLASSCGDPCVPMPLTGDGVVPYAWRFDYDNQCWWVGWGALKACDAAGRMRVVQRPSGGAVSDSAPPAPHSGPCDCRAAALAGDVWPPAPVPHLYRTCHARLCQPTLNALHFPDRPQDARQPNRGHLPL
jgi:hypothetical protein